MNTLSHLFLHLSDGDTVTLESGQIYNVCPQDSFALTGYYCTNTAAMEDNPDGRRCAAVYLKDKRDVTIDGNGAVILVHGKMTPFVFDGCIRITIRNLTVDYACPTMSEFTVLSNSDGVCDLQIHTDTRFRVDGSTLYWRGEDRDNGTPYWEQASNADRRHVKVYDPIRKCFHDFDRDLVSFTEIEQTGAHTLRVTLRDKTAAFIPGTVFQTRNIIRDQTGALFERCRDVLCENLRVKFMHGLGMVAQFCENVTYRNCDFTPAAGRTAAGTADFFQVSGCRGKIRIENCKAWGAHDDYVNVHGTHLRVAEVCGNQITVRFMHPETWGMQAFAAGDRVEFIRFDTLRPYGEAVVKSFTRLSDTDILLRLDRAVPKDVLIGRDVVENATWTPDLVVRGCDFGPNWGRGILCTTRGEVIIEQNRFYHLAGPALLVEDDCNFWFESGYTRHVTFRDNTVIGCDCAPFYTGAPVIRYAPKVLREDSTEYVHEKLTVKGNIFRESAAEEGHGISLEYLAEADITDNTFDAPLHVTAYRCGTVRQENNTIE